MIARELMTPDPLTVSPQATIAEVWDLMREADVRHVPVVQAEALVGMVSDRDLARVDIARLLKTEGADALREELATPIVQVMNSNVIAVAPDAEIGEVIELLIDHRIGAVPVVLEETREVLGIISYVDVLRALQGVLEEN
ncbi:MAG TPA: CBS domain-containing protein [Methylomirabilota bacterium]|jgi:acetoin utilization protein AcuB